MYKFLCRRIFSFLLDVFLGVELLDCVITLYLTVQGTTRLVSKVNAPFYNPWATFLKNDFLGIITCQLSEAFHPHYQTTILTTTGLIFFMPFFVLFAFLVYFSLLKYLLE